MDNYTWLDLQLFAGEGEGEGGGAAETGVNSEDAAQQRLRELGVPEDKIRRRAKGKPSATPPAAVQSAPATQQTDGGEDGAQAAAAEDHPTEEGTEKPPARMSWEEIMADPEYNRQMQVVVQSRLKSAKGAEEAMGVLTPALELLARQYELDPANIDYKVLAAKISDDNSLYEDKALEMGVPVEEAKKIDRKEMDDARAQREEARTLEQQKIQQHIALLEQQGEELKKVFPNFDLRTELQNPAFARMTAPGVGLSVEDAYYAVHRRELQAASMQVAAQKTAEKISNAIQAGGRRPDEAGTTGRAPSVSTFDYSKASKEQREALKQRIREAAARGEKLYPGQ